jgi:hypothetical protein
VCLYCIYHWKYVYNMMSRFDWPVAIYLCVLLDNLFVLLSDSGNKCVLNLILTFMLKQGNLSLAPHHSSIASPCTNPTIFFPFYEILGFTCALDRYLTLTLSFNIFHIFGRSFCCPSMFLFLPLACQTCLQLNVFDFRLLVAIFFFSKYTIFKCFKLVVNDSS